MEKIKVAALEPIDVDQPPEFYWATIQLEYGRAIRGILDGSIATSLKPPYLDDEVEVLGIMLNGLGKLDGVTYFKFRFGDINSVKLVPIQYKQEVDEVKKTFDYHLGGPQH